MESFDRIPKKTLDFLSHFLWGGFVFCCGILFFFSATVFAVETKKSPELSEAENGSHGVLQSVINTFDTYQNLKESIRETQVSLEFEKNLEFPSLKELGKVKAEILAKNLNLTGLQNHLAEVKKKRPRDEQTESDKKLIEGLIQEKKEEIAELETQKKEQEEIYKTRYEKQQENIKIFTEKLTDLEEELGKQKKLVTVQVRHFAIFSAFFLSLAVVFLLLKFLGRFIINRLAKQFSEQRRYALLKLNQIIFNVLLGLIVLGMIFSQLMDFLPFLAILGTGMAFAVRDSISSFIAWFLIGAERGGYRPGDIIEVDGVVGKVLEVRPILSVLSERTDGYNSGKIITMPNKVIFEKDIFNWSQCQGVLQNTIDILICENSDIDIAKEVLKTIIIEKVSPFTKTLEKCSRKIAFQQCFTANDLVPQVWVENNSHGIMLRGRFLCLEPNSKIVMQNIHEAFVKQTQLHPHITLQFEAAGRKQMEKMTH